MLFDSKLVLINAIAFFLAGGFAQAKRHSRLDPQRPWIQPGRRPASAPPNQRNQLMELTKTKSCPTEFGYSVVGNGKLITPFAVFAGSRLHPSRVEFPSLIA
jgi:hypothetical protein